MVYALRQSADDSDTSEMRSVRCDIAADAARVRCKRKGGVRRAWSCGREKACNQTVDVSTGRHRPFYVDRTAAVTSS